MVSIVRWVNDDVALMFLVKVRVQYRVSRALPSIWSLKRKGDQDGCSALQWGHWRQAIASLMAAKAVTLTTFPFLWCMWFTLVVSQWIVVAELLCNGLGLGVMVWSLNKLACIFQWQMCTKHKLVSLYMDEAETLEHTQLLPAPVNCVMM